MQKSGGSGRKESKIGRTGERGVDADTTDVNNGTIKEEESRWKSGKNERMGVG